MKTPNLNILILIPTVLFLFKGIQGNTVATEGFKKSIWVMCGPTASANVLDNGTYQLTAPHNFGMIVEMGYLLHYKGGIGLRINFDYASHFQYDKWFVAYRSDPVAWGQGLNEIRIGLGYNAQNVYGFNAHLGIFSGFLRIKNRMEKEMFEDRIANVSIEEINNSLENESMSFGILIEPQTRYFFKVVNFMFPLNFGIWEFNKNHYDTYYRFGINAGLKIK